MKTKHKFAIGVTVLVLAMIGIIMAGGFTANNEETWTIIQKPFGDDRIVVIDSKEVFVPKYFGSEATYYDTYTVFFSDRPDEGGADDKSVTVQFSDKGTANFSANVVFSTPFANEDEQLEFHKLARGKESVIIQTVKSALNEASRFTAAKLTASKFVEEQEQVTSDIRDRLMADTLLAKWNITIDAIKLSNINPDSKTKEQFTKQQEAILLAKEADMNKQKFEQQKLATEADFANKIAKQKGEAEVVAVKARTDALREKELAEITAKRKVTVAEFEKEEAEVQKQRAEIDASKLVEVAKLNYLASVEDAKAVIELAQAEEKRIALAGAITETDRVLAEIGAKRDALVAKELAKIQVPQVVMGGGADGGESTLTESLLNLKLLQATGVLDEPKVK